MSEGFTAVRAEMNRGFAQTQVMITSLDADLTSVKAKVQSRL